MLVESSMVEQRYDAVRGPRRCHRQASQPATGSTEERFIAGSCATPAKASPLWWPGLLGITFRRRTGNASHLGFRSNVFSAV